MTTPGAEPQPWSRRRWWGLIAGVLAAQIACIFLLSGRPWPARLKVKPFQFTLPSWPGQVAHELPALQDPTLFALANPHGFSGPAWLRVPPLEHHYYEWTEEPHWLGVPVGQLGETFERYVRSNTPPPFSVAEKPFPELAAAQTPREDEPVRTKSSVRAEGSLADRPLLHLPDLPSWRHNDVLGPTVLLCVVDPAGYVRATALLAESGLRAADQSALDLSRQVRFQPLRSPTPPATMTTDPFRMGRLVFDWHTVAPPTNPAPAKIE